MKSLVIFSQILFLFLLNIRSVFAQCSITLPGQSVPISGGATNCDLGTPGGLISAIIPVVLGVAGFLTVILIVVSGIQFITSQGNPEAAAAARGRLMYALIGFVIIVLAFAVLQIVNRIFLGTGIT